MAIIDTDSRVDSRGLIHRGVQLDGRRLEINFNSMQQLFTCIQCTLDGSFTVRRIIICNKDIYCDIIVLVTDMIKNSVHLHLRRL